MKKIYKKLHSLSKRLRDSIHISTGVIGSAFTIAGILGYSLEDIRLLNQPYSNLLIKLLIVITAAILISLVAYVTIGIIFKDNIDLEVNQTPVEISCGDIFKTAGWKVIGCDTCFRTQVDDVVISKNSLHGQLVLKHGNADEIDKIVKATAEKMDIKRDSDGQYNFPLGTIIPYTSGVDNQTYLMLAMTELNKDFESHTSMAKYEQMLMKMWREISRVYASHDAVLPILGDGISRFDDGPKDKNTLLRCMLCTFRGSGINLNSKIKVVIYGKSEDIPLYELKDIVRTGR